MKIKEYIGLELLPDFIIGGAMKSGTSTLHYILNQHPKVFIPEGEIFFFDIDDIHQHKDFFKEANGWINHNYNKKIDEYLSWYLSFFKQADNSQVVGEDSTTYLASSKAPSRIAKLLPNIKLIFMLRDPVYRTYSHYWHLVQSGRAIYNFEKTIRYMPRTLLQRSFYKNQIKRYKNHFSDSNMMFVIFEEFINNMQEVVNKICKFIGVEPSIDLQEIETHKNPSKTPRSIQLQLLYNRIFKNFISKQNINHLPKASNSHFYKGWIILDKVFKKLNLTTNKKYPPLNSATKSFLQDFFAKENQGLSELINKDVQKYWGYM